jgi:hypothetical protein
MPRTTLPLQHSCIQDHDPQFLSGPSKQSFLSISNKLFFLEPLFPSIFATYEPETILQKIIACIFPKRSNSNALEHGGKKVVGLNSMWLVLSSCFQMTPNLFEHPEMNHSLSSCGRQKRTESIYYYDLIKNVLGYFTFYFSRSNEDWVVSLVASLHSSYKFSSFIISVITYQFFSKSQDQAT